MTAVPVPRCNEADCARPVLAKGLCQTHYERSRERHRHRAYDNDRAIQTRARNRATAALVKRHKDEFDRLYDEMIEDVAQEMTTLRERAAERGVKAESGVVRLRPGTRPADEKPADRLRQDVGRCPKCHALHDTGHICPSCGEDLVDEPRRPGPKPKVRLEDIRHLIGGGVTPMQIAERLAVQPTALIQCAYRAGDTELAARLDRAIRAATDGTATRMLCSVCGKNGRSRNSPCVDLQGRKRGAHSYRLAKAEVPAS